MNKNFAIDLIAADPVVVCEQRRVSSNSGGALGHPKVFINLVRIIDIKLSLCILKKTAVKYVSEYCFYVHKLQMLKLKGTTLVLLEPK